MKQTKYLTNQNKQKKEKNNKPIVFWSKNKQKLK